MLPQSYSQTNGCVALQSSFWMVVPAVVITMHGVTAEDDAVLLKAVTPPAGGWKVKLVPSDHLKKSPSQLALEQTSSW
jgi:hypothetical protein